MMRLVGFFSDAGLNWLDINAHLTGQNNDVVMPSAAIVTMAIAPNPGTVQPYYVKNDGSPTSYSGGNIIVAQGDTLAWAFQTKGTASFTATVEVNGITVDTFQVNLT